MNLPKLSKRLQCAASFARAGAFVADVGTDHAYLPIALALQGTIRGGVVSDIHRGPIDRARAHIREHRLEDRLVPVLCDGLSAIEPYAPEDIFILGMGGELIAEILRSAPWTKNGKIRLVLQPMTHPERLRAFLLEEGYSIVEECLVEEEKIYQLLCVKYTGECAEYTPLELLIGKENLSRRDELTELLVYRWEGIFRERQSAKRAAGAESVEEDRYLQEIGEWKHDGSRAL